MKAVINGQVVAEAPDDDVVTIEGNSYFPPDSVMEDVLAPSATPYTCPWKGQAQYWDLKTPAGTAADGAWSYPEPYESATERVGRDFSGFLAFDPAQVKVSA